MLVIVPDEKGTSSSELCILTLVVVAYFALYQISNALVISGADNQRRVPVHFPRKKRGRKERKREFRTKVREGGEEVLASTEIERRSMQRMARC